MELTKIENTDIYEFRSTGRLTEADAAKLNESFEEFKDRGEKIKLLGVIDKMPIPKELSSFNELYNLKNNSAEVLEKYAIISEKDWVNNMVSVGNFFTPKVPVKSFDKAHRVDAIHWLNQDEDVKEYDPKEYLSSIDIERLKPNVFKLKISHEKVNQAAMTALYNVLDEKVDGEKLNLLVQFEAFPSFDSFKTIMEGIKVDFKAIGSIKKYAVVSDADWIQTYTKIGNFVTPGMDMRFFTVAELEAAESWVII